MNHIARKLLAVGLVWAGLLGSAPLQSADAYSPRQYYGSWHRHSQSGYYYRSYYYKPHTQYAGYKHHYVVLFPDKPKHCYFYNPYSKRYWGRCPTLHDGKPDYSHLPEEYQKGKIAEIPESAFPKSGGLPEIPEAKDDAKLDLPPDDLPEEFRAP